ncbi:MAG: hypothetical protein HY606_15630 [Planctomycetes bacterium]|nr:hypothetical protein [Planctomycetota bacterium]
MKVKNISFLLPLQALDRQIYEYNKDIESMPIELDHYKKQLISIKREILDSKNKIKELELKKKNLDLEIGGIEEKIKKISDLIITAKKLTNEEYQLMLKQKSGFEADKKVIEDKWLEIETEIEHTKKSISLKEDDEKDIDSQISVKTSEINAQIKDLTTKKNSLDMKRSELLTDINDEMLKIYDRVLNSENTNGIVLAKINHQAKRKKTSTFEDFIYSCEGCSMELTPQDVNKVLMADEIIQCRNCSRILYMNEQPQLT